jgi:N,N'-diacetyllegionaminate synthase
MKIIIIAEAGVNHNGKISLAKKMIEKASKAGADYIKFQLFSAENLVTKNSVKANYAKKNLDKNISNYKMLKNLEFTLNDFLILKKCCKKNKIKFLLSPFSIKDVKNINKIGIKTIKIPSGEINNLPYLKYIGKQKKNIILSTGMSNIKEISNAIKILNKSGTNKKNITVLQCNTEYPTPYNDANLLAMNDIKKRFNVSVGYSDHTLGLEVPIAAAALGAKIIEKHFTLNKKFVGPDHKASLNIGELSRMITSIRIVEKALGNGQKIVTNSEKKNIIAVRKSIVASRNIKKGEIFSEDNLKVKRPATGTSPMYWEEIIGTKSKKNYLVDEPIKFA